MADYNSICQFSPSFDQTFQDSLAIYDKTIEHLRCLVNDDGCLTDDHGVCNMSYHVAYITPKDISTYISHLIKALSARLICGNPTDLEKFSVEMAKRFVSQNCSKEGDDQFQRGNIFASSSYVDPRTQTLMDMLVQMQNAFFDRAVYSKYEMQQRAKNLKSDYGWMNGLHFSTAMKAVVKAIPDALGKQYDIGTHGYSLIMQYIESFILFACSLNTYTVEQMIGYVQPRSTFIRKEKKSGQHTVQEACDTDRYSPVYMVLSAGTNKISKAIGHATNSKWSHCSISFDPSMREMFSYGLKLDDDVYPSKSGLRRESLFSNYLKDRDVWICGMFMPSESVTNLRSIVEEKFGEDTKFDIALLFKKALNDDTTGSKNSNKRICTTFVNGIFQAAGKALSGKAVPSPQQMKDAAELSPDEVFQVYEGPASEYDAGEAASKMMEHSKQSNSKPFIEYVTECCIIKTNDITVRSRIPFDCNMRNVVLQDTTPGFKDTRSALHFMIKDTRSPIHQILVKNIGDASKRIGRSTMCGHEMAMFEPYFYHRGPFCPVKDKLEQVGFHTDVNWLDKIAYGNNFLDGNYRMDAMGNENRHPILHTLETLHRMYCGCGLKTDQELADNIMRIAGLIENIIDSTWCTINRDLTRDILAVLGDCFTRSMMKLYHNNTVCVVYDDSMEDTMIPGYAYLEQFVMEDGEAKPSVTFNDNAGPNTTQKTGALSKLATTIRQFGKWVTDKLAKVPEAFRNSNDAKIKYIESHGKLNNEIAEAIRSGKFTPKLANFPIYNIAAKDITNVNKENAVRQVLDEYANDPNKQVNAAEIKAKVYPGPDDVARQIANAGDAKKEAQLISNYILYSRTEPNPNDSTVNGNMTAEIWESIVKDLTESSKLIDIAAKSMAKALSQGLNSLEKIRKNEEAKASQGDNNQNNQNNQQQQTQPANRADQLFKVIQEISANYQINTVNTITKRFFSVYYDAYKAVVDNYQAQSRTQNANPQPQQQQTQPVQQGQPAPTNPAPAVQSNQGGGQNGTA